MKITEYFIKLVENNPLLDWMPAVKTKLGLYKGSNHFAALRNYAMDLWQTHDPKDLALMFQDKNWDELTQDTEDGFVTHDGDFLNREDAYVYYEALGGQPGQGYIGKGERNWLDSEDLPIQAEPEPEIEYDDEFDDRLVGMKLGFNESSYKKWLFEKKMEPWRLEYKQYYDLVNPMGKRHSDDTYDWSLTGREKTTGGKWTNDSGEEFDSWHATPQIGYNKNDEYGDLNVRQLPIKTELVSDLDYIHKEHYTFLIKTIDEIEYRMLKDKNVYVKQSEPDEDGYTTNTRDENGNLIYMSDEEIEADPRTTSHRRDLTAWDGEICVGVAADEWGAVLIAVVREYRRRGIGTNLGYLYRSIYPDKSSGGMTSRGSDQLKRIWSRFVKRAVDTGKLQAAVEQGTLNRRKAERIVRDAG